MKFKDELAVEVISDEEAYPYITWIGEEVDEAYYQEVMAIEINPGMDKKISKLFSHHNTVLQIYQLEIV